jgi:hypothetical protein
MRVFEYDKQNSQREYYLRNAIFWGLFVSYIPGVWIIGSLLQQGLGINAGFGIAAIGFMAGWLVVGIWRISWQCPRCHNRFYFKWWYGNTFTTKCVHCGFRPGSE